MKTQLASKQTFERIAERALNVSSADDTFVSLGDAEETTLRFANNQVVQHVSVRRPRLSVRVAFGQKVGSAQTNRLDDQSIKSAVDRAQRLAALAPDDPEYLSPLEPQRYPRIDCFRKETAEASPQSLAMRTKPVIESCTNDNLTAAGIMTQAVRARGIAASSGLLGFEESTEARFSLTATAEDSSGWTFNAHRNINALGVPMRAKQAINKALRSKSPKEIPAGHYPVILEPAAVAGIFGPFSWGVGAKSFYRGNSPFVDKLNQPIVDRRLTVESNPSHPDLLASSFASNGLAARKQTWIRDGVLRQLYYDRFTAKKHNVAPNPRPSALIMKVKGGNARSVDELIAQTERAILVTNFWYIRSVDPTDLTVTGMTRDGTFLIEDGKIVAGLKNFRFHDSPLRCLASIDDATRPLEAITLERGKMLLPALKLPDFHFSSVTKF